MRARGGDRQRVDVEKIEFEDPNDAAFLTALDASLEQLAEESPIVAQVVSLRFFAGLSIEQTSEALNIFGAHGQPALVVCQGLVVFAIVG